MDVDPVVLPSPRSISCSALPAKVRFLPLSARYALHKCHQEGRRYGFTFVDAYAGKGIPDELLTVEFFAEVRDVSESVAANVIMDRSGIGIRQKCAGIVPAGFGRVWIKHVSRKEEDLTNIMVTRNRSRPDRWNGKGRAGYIGITGIRRIGTTWRWFGEE